MIPIFPYANIVTGVLLLLIGFCVHWIAQLISVINWNLATRMGLQEKDMPHEYKVYEHAIAVADVAIGWIYGVAAVGLFLNEEWGYKMAWIPGSILLYHAISAWFWERNRRIAGRQFWPESLRIGWCGLNALTGILSILLAWTAKSG